MPFIRLRLKKTSAETLRQEKGKMDIADKFIAQLTSLDHAPIFLIPGIHGNYRELKMLADQLLLQSGGTQKIFIYEDPYFMIADTSRASNYTIYKTATAHAREIAANLMEHYEKPGTLIPPLILGFSYGAMLAHYVVEALIQDHPNLSPVLIALDGGAHSLLKTYHASSDKYTNTAYIDELLLIVNTAATSARLRFTLNINNDLINKTNNTVNPVKVVNYLYNEILALNEDSAAADDINTFTRLIQVVSQNFDTITENEPTPFIPPQVYTIFTQATLLKLNQHLKAEDIKVFGGFENSETPPTNVTDITTDEIKQLTHLELIQAKGASLVAEAIHAALCATFNVEEKKQARIKTADAKWHAAKAKASNFSNSSSDEEDSTSILASPPKKETPAKDELSKPTSPTAVRTSRKREQRRSDDRSFSGSSPTSSSSSLYGSTTNSDQSSDIEYDNAHSAEEFEAVNEETIAPPAAASKPIAISKQHPEKAAPNSKNDYHHQPACIPPSVGMISHNASTLYGTSKPTPPSAAVLIKLKRPLN